MHNHQDSFLQHALLHKMIAESNALPLFNRHIDKRFCIQLLFILMQKLDSLLVTENLRVSLQIPIKQPHTWVKPMDTNSNHRCDFPYIMQIPDMYPLMQQNTL